MNNFFSLSRQAVGNLCSEYGVSPVHAKVLFRNLYKRGQLPPWSDLNLPRSLQQSLQSNFGLPVPEIARQARSSYDGSVKFVLRLADGLEIESVLMPESTRVTLCLSSQVGCQQGCVFCHTGRMGLKRNLTAGEIVGQVIAANRWIEANLGWLDSNELSRKMRITNLVFMGMGEPLDNVDAVVEALDIVTDPQGLGLGPRRVSVSTAGHLDGLREITRRRPRVRVALSLHTANELRRTQLMPINRKWPIRDVVSFLKDYATETRIHILVQYTLIEGVNDSIQDAQDVAALLVDVPVKVNLIPLNEIEVTRLKAPCAERIQAFRDVLHRSGLRTMVRYSKGQDIGAACGQLVL